MMTLQSLDSSHMRRTQGFTMLELLLALSLIVILGAVAMGVFTSHKAHVEKDVVIQKAMMLDLAKMTYLRKNEASAPTEWANADSDSTRYHLLKPYLIHSPEHFGEGVNPDCYTPLGYQYHLGKLHESTRIRRLSDNTYIWP